MEHKRTVTYIKVGDEVIKETHSILSVQANEMPEPYTAGDIRLKNEEQPHQDERHKSYTRFGKAVFADYPNDPCFRCPYVDCIWDEGGKSSGCHWRRSEIRCSTSDREVKKDGVG